MRYKITAVDVMGGHLVTVESWSKEQFSDESAKQLYALAPGTYDPEDLGETLSMLIDMMRPPA